MLFSRATQIGALVLLSPFCSAAASKSADKCLTHHEVRELEAGSRNLVQGWNGLADALSAGLTDSNIDTISDSLDTIRKELEASKANLTGKSCVEGSSSQLTNSTSLLLDTVRSHIQQYFEAALTVVGNGDSHDDLSAASVSNTSVIVQSIEINRAVHSSSSGEEGKGGKSRPDEAESGYKYQGGHVTGDEGAKSGGKDSKSSNSQPDNKDPAYGTGYESNYQQPQYEQPQYGRPQYLQPQYGQPQPQYGQPQYGQPQYGQPQYGQPQYGQPQYGQPQYGQPQYGQPQYGQYGQPRYGESPYGQYGQPAYRPQASSGGHPHGIAAIPGRVLQFTEKVVEVLLSQLEEIGSIFTIGGTTGAISLVNDVRREIEELAGRIRL